MVFVIGLRNFLTLQWRVSNQDTLVADILTTPPLPFSFLSLRSKLFGTFSIIIASKLMKFLDDIYQKVEMSEA